MEAIMTNILTREFYVSGNECDYDGRIHVHTLQSKLMDCAYIHAEDLDVSRQEVQALTGGGVWVLVRLGVSLNAPLHYPQTFTIDTWPTGVKGPYFGRDYVIRRGDETVGQASSAWLIVNPDTTRIIRGRDLPQADIHGNPGAAVCYDLEKIAPPDELKVIGRHIVQYADLDINNHVNNTRYLAIAANALALHTRRQCMTAWQINYTEQCLSGEEIVLSSGVYDDRSLYVVGEVDGKRRFDMRVWLG